MLARMSAALRTRSVAKAHGALLTSGPMMGSVCRRPYLVLPDDCFTADPDVYVSHPASLMPYARKPDLLRERHRHEARRNVSGASPTVGWAWGAADGFVARRAAKARHDPKWLVADRVSQLLELQHELGMHCSVATVILAFELCQGEVLAQSHCVASCRTFRAVRTLDPMAVRSRLLSAGVGLANGVWTDLYVVPAGRTAVIRFAVLYNAVNAAQDVRFGVRRGAATSTIKRNPALPSGGLLEMPDISLSLSPGDAIAAHPGAGTGSLNVQWVVSGSLLLGEPE
jgi:hypothetical protein